jgi:hypothetical protein
MGVTPTLTNVKADTSTRLTDLEITGTLTVDGVDVVTALLLASGQVADLNGEADALVLDADADTTISAPTDDQIDIEIAGADDFRFTANTFTALSGSALETNTINETTAASGVTVDGVLLKDNTSSGGRQPQTLTASGAITVGNHGVVQLNHATVVIAATLAAPQAGADLVIVDNSASGTAAHTVTLPAGVTWDGTNNTATLNAPGEALHVVALSATRWFILENIGSVALSNV